MDPNEQVEHGPVETSKQTLDLGGGVIDKGELGLDPAVLYSVPPEERDLPDDEGE